LALLEFLKCFPDISYQQENILKILRLPKMASRRSTGRTMLYWWSRKVFYRQMMRRIPYQRFLPSFHASQVKIQGVHCPTSNWIV